MLSSASSNPDADGPVSVSTTACGSGADMLLFSAVEVKLSPESLIVDGST
jgi:hypothetical protein